MAAGCHTSSMVRRCFGPAKRFTTERFYGIFFFVVVEETQPLTSLLSAFLFSVKTSFVGRTLSC